MPKKGFKNLKAKLVQQICINNKYSRLHFFTDMKLTDFYFGNIALMGEAYAIKFKVSITASDGKNTKQNFIV